MNHKLLSFLSSFLILICGINAQTTNEIVIGNKHKISSDVLSEEREFWVSLPDSYNDSETAYKKYPLLILLDGHVHFKSTVGMVDFMSTRSTDKRDIPEMIVVGILNVSRERDFTPDKIITKRKNKTGGGDNFLAFLESELIPKLDKEFRTIPYRILVGHSLAGLLTTHAYMKSNTLFNSFISIDPSFGNWDDTTMDEKVDKIEEHIFKRPLYIATANWDKRNLRNRDRHIRYFESLKRKYKGDLNAKQKYYEDKNHSSVPLPAIYDGLSFIFKGYNYPYRKATSLDNLVKHFEDFSNQVSFNFNPPEALVNRIGYRFLRSKNMEDKKKALEFFKLNSKNYPESFNVFYSLGVAQNKLGYDEDALKSFKKSLELNPNNKNARMMIDEIKNK